VLFTVVFNYMEGTYVTQVRCESIDEVIEAWLEKVRGEQVHRTVTGPEPMSVLDYFESCVENKKGFEEQIMEELHPNIGSPERPVGLTGVPGAWCANFLIDLLDIDHSSECAAQYDRGLSDPDTFEEPEDVGCPACADQASHLCELYVVETAERE
jgi:hypothetical protein